METPEAVSSGRLPASFPRHHQWLLGDGLLGSPSPAPGDLTSANKASVNRDAEQECPACGLRSTLLIGPLHPYMLSSPGCWAAFGEVLAGARADPTHQLATDAYAVSHPGAPTDRRAVQSVAVHLMLLHLVLVDGVDPVHRHWLLRRMARPDSFPRLEPPALKGQMTAAEVLAGHTPEDHLTLIRCWAADVWAAWSSHHATVRTWVKTGLNCSTTSHE